VDSVDEIHMVTEKTLAYERALETRKQGIRRAAFVSVPGWVNARSRMAHWAGMLPKGWTSMTLDGSNPKDRRADENHVVTLLNEGASLVLHVGHGEDNGWADSLHTGGLKRLRNADRLPVILSAGCSTSRFATLPPYEPYEDVNGLKHKGTDSGEVFTGPPAPPSVYARGAFNRTGFGEAIVRKGPDGAAAYIGCNTGGQPCALNLLEGFMLSLHDLPEPTLGDCWARAIYHYYDSEHLEILQPNADWYPPSIFFQGMKYMVFGDPALRLPGPRP
jgi:hypothetical protein